MEICKRGVVMEAKIIWQWLMCLVCGFAGGILISKLIEGLKLLFTKKSARDIFKGDLHE